MRQDVEEAVRKAAAAREIEPAALLAVVDIESSGAPFEPADGVTPQFLFERHIFYRQLAERAPEKLDEAVSRRLAHPKWQPETQYGDQGSSAARLALLARAAAIDPECAYRSCSWGVGQTMGFHAESLGYPSAQAMFETMRGNINAQIEAMIGEIKHSNLESALANREWAAFARGYNGAGYRRNEYDTKLAAAYARWKRGESRAPEPSQAVRITQAWLNTMGASIAVDGYDGPETEEALLRLQDEIKEFQSQRGLVPDGIIGPRTLAAVKKALSEGEGGPGFNPFEIISNILEKVFSPMTTTSSAPATQHSWMGSIFLWLLSNSQIQSIMRTALHSGAMLMLARIGLTGAGVDASVVQFIDYICAGIFSTTGLYYSAQNASPNISNPARVTPSPTPAVA